jgi:hypothetical protein
MADAMQGIMALSGAPTMDQGPRGMMGQEARIDPAMVDPAITQYARSNPKEFSDDILGGMEQADPQLAYQLRSMLAQYQLPQEVIDALALMVDTLLSDPGNYEENRMEFIREGVPEEILPPTFDAAYLGGLNLALNQMSGMEEPQRFAQGGIAQLKPVAQALSQMGREGDTMLAHINPAEARLLRVMGGSGTINPYTGMPEFKLKKAFKSVTKAVTGTVKSVAGAVGGVVKAVAKPVVSVVKGVANVVKSIAKSPIGKIALTVAAVYAMGPTALNVAGNLGLQGATALGVNTFLGSTAVNLASGQNIKDSIKGGAVSGLMAGGTAYLFPSMLPESYKAGAPTGIPSVAGAEGIPPPAAGDYASSVDAMALDAAAAREAADFAAAGGVTAPVNQGIGALSPTAPSVAAPSIPQITTEIPQAGMPGIGIDEMVSAGGQGASFAGTAPPPNVSPGFMDTVRSAYDTVATPVKDFYNEYISPSGIREAGQEAQYKAYTDTLLKTGGKIAADGTVIGGNVALATEAFKAAAPGVLATYGPLALAGTGALLATGAFTPVQPEPPGLVGDMATTPPVPKDIGIGDVNIVNAPPPGFGTGYDLGDTSFYRTASQYDPSRQFQAPQFTVRKPEDYLYAMNMFPQQQDQGFAQGGIASLGYKAGGKVRTYPRKTGAINGPGTETSDSIPALLSDGEFVFTAKAVRGAGGGSRRAGAKRMYALMKALENKANGR